MQKKNEKNNSNDPINEESNSSGELTQKRLAERKEPKISIIDSLTTTSNLHSTQNQVREQKEQMSKRNSISESDILPNSSFVKDGNSVANNIRGKASLHKQIHKVIRSDENQSSSMITRSVAITDFPLLEHSTQWPEFKLRAFSENSMFNVTEPKVVSKTNEQHGFSLSVFAAPNFSFDRLEDDDHLAGPGRDRRDARRDEKDDISFSAGLFLNYDFSKHWSLQTGIGVTSSSTSIAPKIVYAKADNNGHTHYELHCSSGYVYLSPKGGAQPLVGDSAQTAGTTSKLVYVNIPASVSYRINLGHFTFSPTVGAGLNILTSNKTKTTFAATSESATTSVSGLKSNYAEGRLGVGIEYGLTKKLSLGLRPNARLALTPINQETPVKSYQNFLSLEAGVRVKF